jgi:hypothetical protein
LRVVYKPEQVAAWEGSVVCTQEQMVLLAEAQASLAAYRRELAVAYTPASEALEVYTLEAVMQGRWLSLVEERDLVWV